MSRGFSVASVLLLTAAVAVVLASLKVAVGQGEDLGSYEGTTLQQIAVAAAGLAAIVLGIVAGATWRTPAIGILVGFVLGWFGGASAGLLLASPRAAPVLVGGAAVIVAFGLTVRLLSARGKARAEKAGQDDLAGAKLDRPPDRAS